MPHHLATLLPLGVAALVTACSASPSAAPPAAPPPSTEALSPPAPDAPPPPAPDASFAASTDQVSIASVTIAVRPDAGSAFCTFQADGSVQGGHLSGDARPFVHQDSGQVGAEVITAMWAATRAVLAEPSGPPLPETAGTESLSITRSDGSSVRHVWPFGQVPASPKVAALRALLLAHHIGGW